MTEGGSSDARAWQREGAVSPRRRRGPRFGSVLLQMVASQNNKNNNFFLKKGNKSANRDTGVGFSSFIDICFSCEIVSL